MSLVKLGGLGAKAAKKSGPFYSAVDEAMANLKRPKGTGMEFLTEVLKTKGVKPAEIADRKLEQAFKAKGKMTKEEAQQVLADNPPPKVSERVMEEMTDDAREERYRELMENRGYEKYNDVPTSVRQQFNDEIDAEDVQHAAHRLPGGDNYREILLKLPKEFSDQDSRRMLSLEANLRRGELPDDQMQELVALQAKKQNSQDPYYSSHYLQDPNVLAHMRVIDRTGPNGEKVLHVEEIQSDWHQEGRKKGYGTLEEQKKHNEFEIYSKELAKKYGLNPNQNLAMYATMKGMDPTEVAKYEQLQNAMIDVAHKVPDAPFKKNWHELAMKRLLNYAADNGYDSIAITPGMEQAKRWKNEALKVHYDQKIPQFLNEFGKPYGTQVDQMPFDAGGYKVNRDDYPLPYRVELQNSPDIISRHATPEEAWAEAERLGQLPLHSFKITPEMRESIKQKGLPLYQQIGIPTAGAGAASQMPETMQEPELEPEIKKADGGAINYNTAPDMADGGRIMQGAPFKHGGKVNMTTNRDAMFMELSNKKLKRK
jgi:hypothetical protein